MQQMVVSWIIIIQCTTVVFAQRKILALHGGGGTGVGFCESLNSAKGNDGLANALGSGYEFICPDGGYRENNGYLWVPDPPDKSEPTTDPDVAIQSVNILDQIVEEEGPFYGILGYSQGSMFAAYYASIATADTFDVALMFAGYLPETHLGLLAAIDNASPIDTVDALVWAGGQDMFYCFTLTQYPKFLGPTVIVNQDSGHIVPDRSDSTFDLVVDFINSPGNATSSPEIPPDPENCETSGAAGGGNGIFSFLWMIFCK